MKTSLKLIVVLLSVGILVVSGSCGNSNGTVGDTLLSDSVGNPGSNSGNQKLPDSLAALLLGENYATRGPVDSILIDDQTIVYNIGMHENKYQFLMLLSGIGSGSGGVSISILQKENGGYTVIQNFFSFPEGIRTESTGNIFDINLYYRNVLFDEMCPVSFHYTWTANHYTLKEINYVNAATGVVYTGELLDQLHIISDTDLIPEFPFVKKTKQLDRFNVNRIDVDTLSIDKTEKLLLFKNNCGDEITADHIWLVKENNDQYTLLEEVDAQETHEVIVQKKKNGYPEIAFGDTVLRWNNQNYMKSPMR